MDTRDVLIVEDQWESSDLIADVIRLTFQEWTISQVSSGREAIELASKQFFDVVIIDIALADGLTGLDIVRRLAESTAERKPRVILVTGMGDKAVQGVDASKKWLEQLSGTEQAIVEGFFQKPYPWKDFLTAMARGARTPLPEGSRFFKQDAA